MNMPHNIYDLSREYRQRLENYATENNQCADTQPESTSLVEKIVMFLKSAGEQLNTASTPAPIEEKPMFGGLANREI